MKKLIISGNLYRIIKEGYPSTFDWKTFKNLPKLKDKIKYAIEKLGQPKKGSSRWVFLVDNDIVLKIAINQVGYAQNRKEAEPYLQNNFKKIIAKVFRADDNDSWIEMERVKPIKNYKQLETIFGGYNLNDIIRYIRNYRAPTLSTDKELFKKFEENNFIEEIYKFYAEYDMLVGDLIKPNSWGFVKRGGKEVPVLFDYGLSSDDFKEFYNNGQIKRQFKKE